MCFCVVVGVAEGLPGETVKPDEEGTAGLAMGEADVLPGVTVGPALVVYGLTELAEGLPGETATPDEMGTEALVVSRRWRAESRWAILVGRAYQAPQRPRCEATWAHHAGQESAQAGISLLNGTGRRKRSRW